MITPPNMIQPQMMVSLNYAVAATCFLSSYILHRKNEKYRSCSLFMLFTGTAALFGGFTHHIWQNYDAFKLFMDNLVPTTIRGDAKLDLSDEFVSRLWYVTILSIGFSEFYFMRLFIYPVINNRFQFLKTYLKFMLIVFSIAWCDPRNADC